MGRRLPEDLPLSLALREEAATNAAGETPVAEEVNVDEEMATVAAQEASQEWDPGRGPVTRRLPVDEVVDVFCFDEAVEGMLDCEEEQVVVQEVAVMGVQLPRRRRLKQNRV